MAKINVYIDKFAVKKIFDPSLKGKAAELAGKLAARHLDKAKFVVIRADKKKTGFLVKGSLSLTQEDKKLKAELSLVLATWPDKSMFGFAPKSSAVGDIMGSEAKITDVAYVLDPLFESMVKKAMPAMQKQAKKTKAKAK